MARRFELVAEHSTRGLLGGAIVFGDVYGNGPGRPFSRL